MSLNYWNIMNVSSLPLIKKSLTALKTHLFRTLVPQNQPHKNKWSFQEVYPDMFHHLSTFVCWDKNIEDHLKIINVEL